MTHPDQARARITGGYLIERLIALRTFDQNKPPSQNELAQLFYPDKSPKTGRDYINKLRQGERSLTTGELVDLLYRLQEYYQSQQQYQRRTSDRTSQSCHTSSYVLTPEEMLVLLQKLVQLTPAECQQLSLPAGMEEVMLQQALLNLSLYQDQRDYETIISLYRSSIGLAFVQETSSPFGGLDDVHRYIETLVEQDPPYLPAGLSRSKLDELASKAKREIDRILLKCGVGQFQFQFPNVYRQGQSAYIQQYLPRGFVRRLTQAVIENELLTQDFPIFIKTITIQQIGPFPLRVATQPDDPGLLLGNLLRFDDTDVEIASQYANRVTVHFYMRLPADYQSDFPAIFEQLKSQDDTGLRIDFSLSSTGIGGTLSHVIKVINLLLLTDNQSLRSQYFPIAHDVLINQEIIRSNMPSPVWSHSLVQLCKVKTLAAAMDQSKTVGKLQLYEQFSFGDQVGRGDYCGFDLILCSANAALQARLRAIRYTEIAPANYGQELCRRIERLYLLQEAISYVESYPFSSFALSSRLRTTLLRSLQNRALTTADPYSLFDACLTIAQIDLNEGAYRRAYSYLDQVAVLKGLSDSGINWLRRFGNENQATLAEFEIFSGALITRFELCRAHYFYLVDRRAERGRRDFLPSYISLDVDERTFNQRLVDEAWQALNRAEEHLNIRLAKYFIINEVSQGLFHPHNQLLAEIYFLRAKLLIFAARQVRVEEPSSPHYIPTDSSVAGTFRETETAIHSGRLYLMEKARLYAASNGNEEQYACYTACQAWLYLMAAFSSVPEINVQVGTQPLRLNRDRGLNWARRLRDHALISYAETGQRCYYQIKENSGLSDDLNPPFGNYRISAIPPISEMLAEHSPGQDQDSGVLYLDMSLLSVRREWCGANDADKSSGRIYLFGAHACYLLLARGLFHLCSNQLTEGDNEFEPLVEQTDDPQLWDRKLHIASRLLNLAWAIADDGAQVHQSGEDGQYDIRRNFMSRDFANSDVGGAEPNPTDPDVASVRDLYPHRVTEIADLGRVFAAACLTLRFYTAPVEQQQQLDERISWILGDLQSLRHCSRSITRQTLRQQERYNGHMTVYLERCRDILIAECQHAKELHSGEEVRSHLSIDQIIDRRDQLVHQLFSALHTDSP